MQLNFKEKITLIGFAFLCPQIFAEASLGKVFKHDAPSGKVEVLLNPGNSPAGTVWIGQTPGRIPCLYIAIFHTKYVCSVEKNRSVKKGAAVYARQAAGAAKEAPTESAENQSAANFEGPFFEIYKPDDWLYEKDANKHVFASGDGSARWEVQLVPNPTGQDACSFALTIADAINSQSSEYIRSTKSVTSSPELARTAKASDACYGIYEITTSGKPVSFVLTVYTVQAIKNCYLVLQQSGDAERKLHVDTLLKLARSFRLRPAQ